MKARWLTIILVLGFSLYKMLPLAEKVNLGLDLQGGMHVVLGVDTEAAVSAKVDNLVFQLNKELQSSKISFKYVRRADNSVVVGINDNTDKGELTKIAEYFGMSGKVSGDIMTLSLTAAEIDRTRENAVMQALKVIRNRVDAFGVAEPLIQRQGDRQILVQLPGETDPDRAIKLIGQTAQLKFYLVDSAASVTDAVAGYIPYGSALFYQVNVDKKTGREYSTPMVLKKDALLGGEHLVSASVRYDDKGALNVAFTFDPVGAKIFEDITTMYKGGYLAIVLDDKVYSAPYIKQAISGGQGVIDGNFTIEEASDLAVVLSAGNLPAPITVEENRTVGPSLGQDSINSGVKACIIGLAAISIFMLVYYRLSGVIANIGLICNFVVLLGVLCWIGATLTMPGIAGIILTLGMAVDANVLIFERIREELRGGRTVLNAFEVGYKKAFSTIVDANITSLIAAMVLYNYGTGPVKGFAVTLSLGLIASMFTAIFVTRTVFLTFIVKGDSKSISI